MDSIDSLEQIDSYMIMDQHPPLRSYAFIGIGDDFLKKIKYLSSLAEKENWYYHNPKKVKKNHVYNSVAVLYQYIMHTFAKALDDNKVIETDENAIFNTGLLTNDGQEIFMLFELNAKQYPKWFFKSFYVSNAPEIPKDLRDNLPSHVDYFEDCHDAAYFDVSLPIYGSFEHIIEDNFDRLPAILQTLPKQIIVDILNASISIMKKRIIRNNRLIIPQYYNKRIMYLAPLKLGYEVIPLAIEKQDNTYRFNTILTSGMAYCNARLIMNPESNWLYLAKDK
jgi:hypothetical protein